MPPIKRATESKTTFSRDSKAQQQPSRFSVAHLSRSTLPSQTAKQTGKVSIGCVQWTQNLILNTVLSLRLKLGSGYIYSGLKCELDAGLCRCSTAQDSGNHSEAVQLSCKVCSINKPLLLLLLLTQGTIISLLVSSLSQSFHLRSVPQTFPFCSFVFSIFSLIYIPKPSPLSIYVPLSS